MSKNMDAYSTQPFCSELCCLLATGVDGNQSVPLASVPFEKKSTINSTLALKTSKSFIQLCEHDFNRIGHLSVCTHLWRFSGDPYPVWWCFIFGIRNMMLLKVASFYCILVGLSSYYNFTWSSLKWFIAMKKQTKISLNFFCYICLHISIQFSPFFTVNFLSKSSSFYHLCHQFLWRCCRDVNKLIPMLHFLISGQHGNNRVTDRNEKLNKTYMYLLNKFRHTYCPFCDCDSE